MVPIRRQDGLPPGVGISPPGVVASVVENLFGYMAMHGGLDPRCLAGRPGEHHSTLSTARLRISSSVTSGQTEVLPSDDVSTFGLCRSPQSRHSYSVANRLRGFRRSDSGTDFRGSGRGHSRPGVRRSPPQIGGPNSPERSLPAHESLPLLPSGKLRGQVGQAVRTDNRPSPGPALAQTTLFLIAYALDDSNMQTERAGKIAVTPDLSRIHTVK